MAYLGWIPRHAGRLACVVVVALTSVAHAFETMAVKAEVVGNAPVALGYNLGHFAENSNAADWFRYSGADSARLFVARKDLEKTDDKTPWGDGVVTYLSAQVPVMRKAETSRTTRSHAMP